MALVGVEKVAEALNIDVRRIQQLVHEGMPKASRGRYDLAACMLWYIRFLQSAIKHKGAPTTDAVRFQRERLLKAQADREEMQAERDRGKLVPVEQYYDTMSRHINGVRLRLLSLPANIAPHLEGEDRNVIRSRLDEGIRNIMAAIAIESNGNGNGTKRASPTRRTAPRAVGATAKDHGKPVGRSK